MYMNRISTLADSLASILDFPLSFQLYPKTGMSYIERYFGRSVSLK